MSDATIALLACPPDLSEAEEAIGWLPAPIPGFRRILAVNQKVKVPAGVETLNLMAGYPSELARIESHRAMLGFHIDFANGAADSLALFALRQLLRANEPLSRVALVRKPFALAPACLEPAFARQDRPFARLVQDPGVILFDRCQTGADLALSLALDTALSGAVYALATGQLEELLEHAQEVALSASFRNFVETTDANESEPDEARAQLGAE